MTDQPESERSARVPTTVLVAVIAVGLQLSASLLAPFLLAATSALDYLQDRPVVGEIGRAISFGIGFLLALGAVATLLGRRWGRELVVMVEILIFAVGLLGLAAVLGIQALDPTAGVGYVHVVGTAVSCLLFPVVVCGLLATRSARRARP